MVETMTPKRHFEINWPLALVHSIPSWLVWAEMAHKPVKPSWGKQTTGVKSLLPKYILWILARRCKLMINYTWQSPKTTIARFSTRNIVCKQTCTYLMLSKGQTKSKWFFQADVSSKKTNERILLYYYETSGWLVFIHFLEEIEDTKKKFRN